MDFWDKKFIMRELLPATLADTATIQTEAVHRLRGLA